MSQQTIVQYGKFKIHQENLDELKLQMHQYIIAAINHNFDIESYIGLYGEDYATNVHPNMIDEETLKSHVDNNELVPFYAQSGTNSLRFIADSLNQKNQNDNLMTLMLLVDNYQAEFEYIELELDDENVITKAYDCKSIIYYKEVSDKPNEIDIQTIFQEEYRNPVELESLEILT